MYKLLIVEDEKWEREGLVEFLDWSDLGIEIIGAAVNGARGLSLVRECHPDIIITDIKMPIMDGMEFTKRVRQLLPDCKVIIITGYDDFEYAKEAIRLGVFDYLLKPIQKDQLLEILNKTLKSIRLENSQIDYMRSLKHHLVENTYADKTNFLMDILEGKLKDQADRHIADRLNIPFPVNEIVAAVMKFNLCSDNTVHENRERTEALKMFCQQIRESFGDQGILAQKQTGSCEMILCLQAQEGVLQHVRNNFEEIRKYCKYSKISEPVIGIGSVVKTFSLLPESYKQAKVAVEHLFFMKDGNLLFYDEMNESEEIREPEFYQFYASAAEYSKKVLNTVVSLGPEAVAVLTEDLFDFIYSSSVDKGLVCHYFSGLVFELSTLLKNSYGGVDLSKISGEDAFETISAFPKLEDMKNWFLKILLDTNRSISVMKLNKDDYIVEKVMNIIKSEYPCGIGIETIADRLELSPNYLGSLFKNHTGKRFTEVLTDYRMNKAEELLVSGTVTVNDTAKAVGFDNVAYFCTVFKKTHGMSPANYQKKYLRENG